MLSQKFNLVNSDNNFFSLFLVADYLSLSCTWGLKGFKISNYKNLQNL